VNVNQKATHCDGQKHTHSGVISGLPEREALLEAVAIPVEFQHMATMRQVGGFSTITLSLTGWLFH
jgi:hypothetical protein